MTRKDTEMANSAPNPEALAQTLEQGLGYYKLKKFGRAIACFREVVKNLKVIDEGKQQILAKALQSTTTGCMKKKKYKKAIKSAKLTLRVLNYIMRNSPEAKAELMLAQQKLLAALEGYLNFTLEQHKRFTRQELKRGNLPKGSVFHMCRDGLNLLNKPLIKRDAQNNKIKIPNPTFIETLKELLQWAQQAAEASYKEKDELAALCYCKIATGPIRETLSLALSGLAKETTILVQLAATQAELEHRLNEKAAQALEQGTAIYLTTKSDELAAKHEEARKYLQEAATQYIYLENVEKIHEAMHALKSLNAMLQLPYC